jgi:hypothetical protein
MYSIGKVVPVLFSLTEHNAMKAYWGSGEYSSMHSLTSALDGGEWSGSCPSHFTPRERAPGTHWIGGWVGPRAIPDTVGKRKIPSPHQELNPRTLGCEIVCGRSLKNMQGNSFIEYKTLP